MSECSFKNENQTSDPLKCVELSRIFANSGFQGQLFRGIDMSHGLGANSVSRIGSLTA